jgi:pyridoxamine 5'-phosphate oxidase family protein
MTLSEPEQVFLATQRLGRLATVDRNGAPQVKPVGFSYNAALGTIDIGGFNMAASAKYKNVRANPKVAFVVDDIPEPEKSAAGIRFLEIRGDAETVSDGPGDGQPNTDGHLAPEIIRIHPRRVLSGNLNNPGLSIRDANANANADGGVAGGGRWPA